MREVYEAIEQCRKAGVSDVEVARVLNANTDQFIQIGAIFGRDELCPDSLHPATVTGDGKTPARAGDAGSTPVRGFA